MSVLPGLGLLIAGPGPVVLSGMASTRFRQRQLPNEIQAPYNCEVVESTGDSAEVILLT